MFWSLVRKPLDKAGRAARYCLDFTMLIHSKLLSSIASFPANAAAARSRPQTRLPAIRIGICNPLVFPWLDRMPCCRWPPNRTSRIHRKTKWHGLTGNRFHHYFAATQPWMLAAADLRVWSGHGGTRYFWNDAQVAAALEIQPAPICNYSRRNAPSSEAHQRPER